MLKQNNEVFLGIEAVDCGDMALLEPERTINRMGCSGGLGLQRHTIQPSASRSEIEDKGRYFWM